MTKAYTPDEFDEPTTIMGHTYKLIASIWYLGYLLLKLFFGLSLWFIAITAWWIAIKWAIGVWFG